MNPPGPLLIEGTLFPEPIGHALICCGLRRAQTKIGKQTTRGRPVSGFQLDIPTSSKMREKPGSQIRLEIGNEARGLGLRETAFTRCSREAAEPCDTRVELEGEYVLHNTNGIRE